MNRERPSTGTTRDSSYFSQDGIGNGDVGGDGDTAPGSSIETIVVI